MIVCFWFYQVIYSSSPFSWPSFKPLAQILFEISCWQDFILIFSTGHSSRKEDNSDKKKNTGQLFFHEEIIYWHNSRKGDNSDKKKKSASNIFPWGIHIWNPSMHGSLGMDRRIDAHTHACMHACTHACMHAHTTPNQYAHQLLQSWGHNLPICNPIPLLPDINAYAKFEENLSKHT